MVDVASTIGDVATDIVSPDDAHAASTQTATTHSGWIRATFATGSTGTPSTRMTELACHAPLKVARPFSRPDGGLDVCVMEVSPGLLDGDQYQLDWHVRAGARVHVRTQSHLRVHSPASAPAAAPARGGLPNFGTPTATPPRGATQHQHVRVAHDGWFELLPEPVVPFAGADIQLTTRVDLEPGAVAIIAEVACAGRIARGELFAFARYSASFDAYLDGRLVVASAQRIEPATLGASLDAPGALGRFTHWGTLHIVSSLLDSDDAAANLVRALTHYFNVDGEGRADLANAHRVVAAADALDASAVVVHMGGWSAWGLTEAMREAARIATEVLPAMASHATEMRSR